LKVLDALARCERSRDRRKQYALKALDALAVAVAGNRRFPG